MQGLGRKVLKWTGCLVIMGAWAWPLLGQPHPDKPYSAKPFSGKPYSGEPYSGKPYSGKPYSGKPFSGKGKVSIESSVDRSRITIGDLITYTVKITRDPDVKVELPGLAANLGQFEIRDYKVHEPRKEKGKIIDQFDYIISTFDIGEFEIPPLSIFYTLPGDTIRQELKTQAIKIVVESLKPSEEGDIRDIKDPLELPRDWGPIIWAAAISLGVLAAGFGVFYYLRRRARRVLAPEKVEPPRPPHEVAYEALEQLRQSDLLARGEIKLFYIHISEIIRRYVEGRYGIDAMEMTTTELLERLRQDTMPEEHVLLVQEFLEACDLVKFAKYIPTEEENERALSLAFEIVDRTKPMPVEETLSEQRVHSATEVTAESPEESSSEQKSPEQSSSKEVT